jgi:hypothetical protein
VRFLNVSAHLEILEGQCEIFKVYWGKLRFNVLIFSTQKNLNMPISSDGADCKSKRIRAFLSIMKCEVDSILDPNLVPQHLLVLITLLR